MPNETNWQDITRRLDITPATQTDACNAKTRARGRAIAKVGTSFSIPAVEVAYADLFNPAITQNLTQAGALMYQLNFTAPWTFKILKTHQTFLQVYSGVTDAMVVCIRYRVGSTVYRYKLTTTHVPVAKDSIQAPFYDKQLIQRNFAIEFWSAAIAPGPIAYGKTFATTFDTNKLSLPSSSDDTGATFAATETVLRSAISVAFPEPLPTAYPSEAFWLTN